MTEMKVSPWKVEGKVDYDRLIKEFGTTPISKEIYKKLEHAHPLLRRGAYFSHRDFDKWVKAHAQGKKVSVVTGRGPSEKMHIGHLIPFIVAKSLQDIFDCDVYLPMSNDEKFFVKKDLSFKDSLKHGKDNIIDLIALGFNPKKTFIFEDFVYTDIYKYASQVAKRISYSTAKSIFGLTPDQNVGWSFYTAVQAAHILLPQFQGGKHLSLVPAGIDQDPFIRLTRDIANHKDFNFEKPAGIYARFLPSLKGDSKMSASEGSLILLTDTPSEVKKKINKYALSGGQKTTEEHRKKGGNTDSDVSFQYLKFLFEESDEKLEEIKQKYESGDMLTGELKAYTIEKINEFLAKHQERRKKAEKQIDEFMLKT